MIRAAVVGLERWGQIPILRGEMVDVVAAFEAIAKSAALDGQAQEL